MAHITRQPTARQVEALRTALTSKKGIIEPSAPDRTLQGLVDRDFADWTDSLRLHGTPGGPICVITRAGRDYLAGLDRPEMGPAEVEDVTAEEIADGVQAAKKWMSFAELERAIHMSDAEVLAIEFKRSGALMRKLLKKRQGPEVEAQAVRYYTKVTKLLAAARRAEAAVVVVEEAPAAEDVTTLFAPGELVRVAPQSWDGFARVYVPQAEFIGTVLRYHRNGQYIVREPEHGTTCHYSATGKVELFKLEAPAADAVEAPARVKVPALTKTQAALLRAVANSHELAPGKGWALPRHITTAQGAALVRRGLAVATSSVSWELTEMGAAVAEEVAGIPAQRAAVAAFGGGMDAVVAAVGVAARVEALRAAEGLLVALDESGVENDVPMDVRRVLEQLGRARGERLAGLVERAVRAWAPVVAERESASAVGDRFAVAQGLQEAPAVPVRGAGPFGDAVASQNAAEAVSAPVSAVQAPVAPVAPVAAPEGVAGRGDGWRGGAVLEAEPLNVEAGFPAGVRARLVEIMSAGPADADEEALIALVDVVTDALHMGRVDFPEHDALLEEIRAERMRLV